MYFEVFCKPKGILVLHFGHKLSDCYCLVLSLFSCWCEWFNTWGVIVLRSVQMLRHWWTAAVVQGYREQRGGCQAFWRRGLWSVGQWPEATTGHLIVFIHLTALLVTLQVKFRLLRVVSDQNSFLNRSFALREQKNAPSLASLTSTEKICGLMRHVLFSFSKDEARKQKKEKSYCYSPHDIEGVTCRFVYRHSCKFNLSGPVKPQKVKTNKTYKDRICLYFYRLQNTSTIMFNKHLIKSDANPYLKRIWILLPSRS